MMELPAGWYVIAEVSTLATRKPNPVRRFGMDLVVWRTAQGDWIVQSDRCPHRSASLSLGWIKDDCVVCPFHGFAFNGAGNCVHVPEIGGKAPGIKVQTFKAAVRHELLWVDFRASGGDLPWFSDLDESFTFTRASHVWKTHFSRCVENQLDYVHLPYVHRTTIGRGFDPRRPYEFNESVGGIRGQAVDRPGEVGYIEFKYPNIWTLCAMRDLRQFVAFVPVDHHETLILMRNYHRLTRIPILQQIVSVFLHFFNNKILSQDHDVVMSQKPADSSIAEREILMKSDSGIKMFREWFMSRTKGVKLEGGGMPPSADSLHDLHVGSQNH
jgi:phenylpropionate dioxygenase-like ring-hydroxylating dioxygenase large terminal subunit